MTKDTDQVPTSLPNGRTVESMKVIRLRDGRVVLRTKFTNGAVEENMVFPADYPNAPQESSEQ